jgi:hypothetical protein
VTSTRTAQLAINRLPWDEIAKSQKVVASGGTVADAALPPLTNADRSAAKEIKLRDLRRPWKPPIDALPPVERLENDPIALSGGAATLGQLLFAAPAAKAVTAMRVPTMDFAFPPKLRFQRFNLQSGKEDGAVQPDFPLEARDVSPDGRLLVGLHRRAGTDI